MEISSSKTSSSAVYNFLKLIELGNIPILLAIIKRII